MTPDEVESIANYWLSDLPELKSNEANVIYARRDVSKLVNEVMMARVIIDRIMDTVAKAGLFDE